MLPEIKKGYLISKSDYDVFDEILVFISIDGTKFACYSQGSRRINSKNGRNLFVGNFLEIEYFLSRTNKLNKLKKVNLIRSIDYNVSNETLFYLVNYIFCKIEWNNANDDIYNFYQEAIALAMMSDNQHHLFNYVLIKLLAILDENFKMCKCMFCKKQKKIQSINLQPIGMICFDCCTEQTVMYTDTEIYYLLKVLKNNFFQISKSQKIDCLNVYAKLYNKLKKIRFYKQE